MTYEEAKLYRKQIENRMDELEGELKELSKLGLNVLGYANDSVRALPQYQKADEEAKILFSQLRKFNQWFVKTYKKEIQADRRKKYARK